MITYEFRPNPIADDMTTLRLQPRPATAGPLTGGFTRDSAANESDAKRVMQVDEFHMLQPRAPAAVHHRAVQTDHLSSAAARWLHKLPVEVRPIITARRHPHVINRLATIWEAASVRQAYFQDLLFSSRPGRRGFSFEVMDELVDLQSYGLQGRRR
jgi:hypothetical protein